MKEKERERDRKREYDEHKITGFFDKDTEFNGDLTFRGSFRIDGHFKGTINSDSMLVVGEEGKVEADVKIGYLVISGEVKGTIRATDKVEIQSHGRALGTIIAPILVVQEGAFLDASCQAGEHAGAIKEKISVEQTKNKEETTKEGAAS
jgi:cytoskeletal protein CcmA (bactofilin family)